LGSVIVHAIDVQGFVSSTIHGSSLNDIASRAGDGLVSISKVDAVVELFVSVVWTSHGLYFNPDEMWMLVLCRKEETSAVTLPRFDIVDRLAKVLVSVPVQDLADYGQH